MRPVIGITTGCEDGKIVKGWPLVYINKAIVDRLAKAGATPILFPITEDKKLLDKFVDIADAVVISGEVLSTSKNVFEVYSKDVLYNSNPLRYENEKAIILRVIKNNKPLLGICRGFQVLNVVEGGTIKDYDITVNNFVKHQQATVAPPNKEIHEIKIKEGTKLKKLLDTKYLKVNSFHRQAVNTIPKDYIISALSPDKSIEAIEAKDERLIIGVQFHPEMLQGKLWDNFFKRFVKIVNIHRKNNRY